VGQAAEVVDELGGFDEELESEVDDFSPLDDFSEPDFSDPEDFSDEPLEPALAAAVLPLVRLSVA
jgi:hypothetical protein